MKEITLTKDECLEKLKDFRNRHSLMLFIPETKDLLWVCPTDTAENLSDEDREAGYNDYIYLERHIYEDHGEYTELCCDDCPMVFFDNNTQMWNEDIALSVYDVLVDTYGSCVDFIPLFSDQKGWVMAS